MKQRKTTAATHDAHEREPLLAKEPAKEPLEVKKKFALPCLTPTMVEPKCLSKVLLYTLTVLAFITRFWAIDFPPQVVFDEVHFGKFASYYLRGTYYFDVHPPLGRLLFAIVGWYIGYDGHYNFGTIGGDYVQNKVPYVQLRAWPAFCGSMIVPFAFEILRELGYTLPACFLGAALIVFDNTLIAQSRLILLDSMLMLFMTMTLYCWVRFSKQRKQPFTVDWWQWLILTGVNLGMVTGVKMVGLLTVATVGIVVLIELWHLLSPLQTKELNIFIMHFMARVVGLVIVPISLYLGWFWIHFSLLTHTGPGDAFMSPSFQSTLIGNKMGDDSQVVLYGSNITFRHYDTAAYLHSHVNRYPLRYKDNRVSSQGQQVTGYKFRDANNVWRLKPADVNLWPLLDDLTAPHVPLRHNDVVVLEHIVTHTHLLTHDVASPHTVTNQEFTAIPLDEQKRFEEILFRVEIDGGKTGDWVKTLGINIRLIHVKTGVAMYTHDKPLPDWGFGQQEINGNKKTYEKSNIWLIEDTTPIARNTELPMGTSDSNNAQSKSKNDENTSAFTGSNRPSFLRKFFELQGLMITHNAGLTKQHPYQSPAITWPFVNRGISFWQQAPNQQIYLLPNPVSWWFTIVMVVVYIVGWGFEKISLRRNVPFLDEATSRQYNYSGGFLFLAWCLHYFPFLGMGRSLFLHHYLPAAIIAFLVAAAVFDFIMLTFLPHMRTGKVHATVGWVITLTAVGVVAATFWHFAPLTYGNVGLSHVELKQRKWLSTWDFQYMR